MIELLNKRSFTAKHFDVGNGLMLAQCHIGQIHFRDGALKDGAFREIDTTLNFNADSSSYPMVAASYEAEVGLMGDVRFHNIDHSIQFVLPNANKVQAQGYDGSAFGKIGKGLIWRDILQSGGHQIVEVRNGSLAKIFHFDRKPLSNQISFLVNISGTVDFATLADMKVDFSHAIYTLQSQQLKVRGAGALSYLRTPRAWNHRGESVDVQLKFWMIGTQIHAMKVIPQAFIDSTFIEAGAWLETDTTTSYYAGSGDGSGTWTGTNQTFATVRAAAGTSADTTSDTVNAAYVTAGTTTNNYNNMSRGFWPIDTSGIGAGGIVSAATWNFYVSTHYTSLGASGYVLDLWNGTQTYNIANYSEVRQATDVSIGGMTNNQYSVQTLNATGRGNINVTGTTNFGSRVGFDFDNSAPTWGNSYITGCCHRCSERTGTNQDPYLSVTYALAGGIPQKNPLNNAIYRM